MKTIETKTAKNGVMIIKINGKRVSRQAAVYSLFEDSVGTTISNEHGHTFTCISNTEPTPAGFCQKVGYLFTDENGKSYIFDSLSVVLDCIGNNYFYPHNVVGEKETVDYGKRRFTLTISYEVQSSFGRTIKNEHAYFATAAAAANHIVAFVTAHPDYIYKDGNITDWNTDNKIELTADDLKAATFNTTADEEIAEINAADVKVNVADDSNGKDVFDLIPTLDELNDVDIDGEEIAEVNKHRFLVNVNFYTNNGYGNGLEKSKFFATAADAANHIIAFAKKNPEYVINTDTNIRDFDTNKKYTLAVADINAISNNEVSEEIAETDKHGGIAYVCEISQHTPCSQIKQFFIGDTENHRAELVTFEGGRWLSIKSNYYGAEIYNGTDNKIHFIVGEAYDYTTGKYFPEPERGMNTTDADEFFRIMSERGVCTVDSAPNRPLVETYYFNGGWWESVTLEQEVVNNETLLFDNDELLIIYCDRYGAKIMWLPNDDIAYFVKYLDENHRYSDDYDRVDEGDFWLEMADRGACTLEPATNELVAHTYELPDTYDEFGEGIRKFKVGDSYNGDVITFYRDRWVAIDSPRLSGAKITRSAIGNDDTIHYHIYQHMYKDGKYRWVEPDKLDVTAEEFWFTMYRQGHMRRTKPFRIIHEQCFGDPDKIYEFMDIKLDYDDDGDGGYYVYNVKTINGKVYELELGQVRPSELSPFMQKIKDAFVTVDTIKIFNNKSGYVTRDAIQIINDEVAAVAETCATLNAHAPEGWEIRFDSEGKFFPVEFKGKTVAKLDSLATQKVLSPERFFEQFRPLIDPNYTAKQQFIADRYNELSMLEEMREEIADDDDQLKTLEEMIEQVKRDIAAEEIAG